MAPPPFVSALVRERKVIERLRSFLFVRRVLRDYLAQHSLFRSQDRSVVDGDRDRDKDQDQADHDHHLDQSETVSSVGFALLVQISRTGV
jgi:hypothetical protein